MRRGWIKLDRGILRWEWYKNANTFRVFVHLLLTASIDESSFEGQVIGRGQCIISNQGVADALGISITNVRTALRHLLKTGEIDIKPTTKYQVVTIVNYDNFQGKIKSRLTNKTEPESKVIANDSQTPDKQLTTLKEYKNKENEKNIISFVSSSQQHKTKFGKFENVLLSDEEYNSLKFNYKDIDEIIEFFDEYIEMKQYKVKNHYLCIKNWVADAVAERKQKRKWLSKEKCTAFYDNQYDEDALELLSRNRSRRRKSKEEI